MIIMIFRSITQDDCEFIMHNWVGNSSVFGDGLSQSELLSMIDSFNIKSYNGNYYEMFGIESEGALVGTFSFYQRESDIAGNAVYIGIEIDPAHRRRGFAADAIEIAAEKAREMGFSKMTSQARISNTASVKLHAKCGFAITEKALSKRGHEVYNYIKQL